MVLLKSSSDKREISASVEISLNIILILAKSLSDFATFSYISIPLPARIGISNSVTSNITSCLSDLFFLSALYLLRIYQTLENTVCSVW